VPEDVSVVGFDDADPTAAALGLTTVRQPHRVKGERAAEALLGLLSGSGRAAASPALRTELITRSSTWSPEKETRRADTRLSLRRRPRRNNVDPNM
jgi:DNA-binding LacI/PurR family transcriptional regulator